jgi:hypothetical protein
MQTKLAFLFVVLVLVAGGLTRWLLAPEEVISTEVHCDLSEGRCQITSVEGDISVLVAPSPIGVMSKHQIQVSTQNGFFVPDVLEVTGLEMEMGLTRVGFRSVNVQASLATLMLPICTQNEMHWQFLLKGQLNGQPAAYRWVLTTQR